MRREPPTFGMAYSPFVAGFLAFIQGELVMVSSVSPF
jgi:hypothetical protein